MTEVTTDVKEEAPAAPVQEQEENSTVVSDEGAKVDRKVYEKVREDMLAYKAEKKAKDAELAQIKAEIEALKNAQTQVTQDDDSDVDTRTKAKVDILYLVQTDPFVKENLDLIEEKMAENPNMTAQAAIREIKSDFFDRMQKEVAKAEPEVLPKQVKPQGNSTTDTRSDVIKDALDGKVENADPRQLEAYKATLARLK